MENYEIANNATFDNPVIYRGITIYPITIENYQLVKSASSAFAVNIAAETDLELIGLPYMEYLMKKAMKDEDFVLAWNILNSILQLSFKEQIHSFKYENDFLRLVIAVPTPDYKEETMCVYREKLNIYNKLARDKFRALINKEQIEKVKKEIDELTSQMFVFHTFNDDDFLEIKKIICYLNDIDDTIIEPRWEEELKKASKILSEINASKSPPSFEDLVDAVAFSLGKLPSDIRDMTVRRFDRYLDLEISKENYKLCRTAELNGTEFKTKINHWLKEYKPRKRYSEAQNVGNGMSEILKK